MSKKVVRIGGASGFWGDSTISMPQLLTVPQLDYIVFDYLAETTMSILQRARMKDPQLGYATDFVSAVIKPYLQPCMNQGVTLIANAGGLNPEACAQAITLCALELGLEPRVAIVMGDDVSPLVDGLREQGVTDLQSGQSLPAKVLSANAYLGAQPIAKALSEGAQIVVTGRCVDSAVTLGALAHEFGWHWHDWDRLAQGSLAGHMIECGAQATGGLFTDWQDVPDWANIGYPVLEVSEDGSFDLVKPDNTGGLVCVGCVAEQLVYEIGDPARYELPDVVCDFRQVRIRQIDAGRVRIDGALGRPPSQYYKVSVTWQDGYQITTHQLIRGIDSVAKAKKTAEALLARTRRQLEASGFDDYSENRVELLGCESQYGENARVHDSRELVLRIGARHPQAKALVFLQKESISAGTSMGPGTRSHFGGRADIQPVIRLFSFLIDKSKLRVQVRLADQTLDIEKPLTVAQLEPPSVVVTAARQTYDTSDVEVPLVRIAWARSGDKGNDANIGVIARHVALLPILRQQLTRETVKDYFKHLVEGEVERFDLPGINGMNFLMHQALGGGGTSSLRSDPLAKSFAQMLLDMPVKVPLLLLDQGCMKKH